MFCCTKQSPSTKQRKINSLVLLPPKTTLSSVLTSSFSIFWLPRNFSAKKWQPGQTCVGTVCYQSRSGELRDHKRQQNKLNITLAQSQSWLKKCCRERRGEGGHTTLLNIVFLMWYISRSGQKWGYENTCLFWLLPFTHILSKYSLMFKGATHKPPKEIPDYSK